MAKIAILGACHLDTVAYYEKNEIGATDIPGVRIDYSIGGAAYNVAVHLRDKSHDVQFLTIVNPHSLSELIVRQALADRGISDRYLVLSPEVANTGAGFVAIREGAETKIAVTATPYDRTPLKTEEIRELVNGTDAVIIDTNLSETQIAKVAQTASKFGLPIFLLVASDAKALRVANAAKELATDCPFTIVSMNSVEAKTVFGDSVKEKNYRSR